jgi:hypothetical protein
VDDGKDVFLMGDCTLGLKKKLERAGIKCYWAWGCPPGEPILAWNIVDRKEVPREIPQEMALLIRERMEREGVIVDEWRKKQKRESRQ